MIVEMITDRYDQDSEGAEDHMTFSVSNWTVVRHQNVVVDRASFELADGESLALLGTMGSGKSSLLLSLASLIPITSGDIEPRIYPHNVGFMFQESSLFPWLTIEDNVRLGFNKRFLSKPVVAKELSKLLSDLGLEKIKERYPNQVSAGQRQIAAIARIMAKKPQYLFLDEPTSRLDRESSETTWKALLELKKTQKQTVLLATHSLTESLLLADQIGLMTEGHLTIMMKNPLTLFNRNTQNEAFFSAYRELQSKIKQVKS